MGMRKTVQTGSVWNSYTMALLLDAYLAVEQGWGSRKAILDRLEKALNRYMQKRRLSSKCIMVSRSNLETQFGKLEYAMTQGKRGLMGAADVRVQDIVEMYRTRRCLYDLYLQYGSQDAEWQICGDDTEEAPAKKAGEEKAAVLAATIPASAEETSLPKQTDESSVSSYDLYQFVGHDVMETSGPFHGDGNNAEKTAQSDGAIHSAEEEPISTANVQKADAKPAEEKTITGISDETSNSSEVHEGKADSISNTICAEEGTSEEYRKYQWISCGTPIENLNFPNRVFNCLKRSHINTVKDMLDYPKDQWLNIRNLGKKSLDFLLPEIEKIKKAMQQPRPPLAEVNVQSNALSREVNKILAVDWRAWSVEIGRMLDLPARNIRKYLEERQFDKSQGEAAALGLLWEWTIVRALFCQKMGRFLDTTRGKGASLEELVALLPEPFHDVDRVQELLRGMARAQQIRLYGHMAYLVYPTLEEHVQRIPHERNRKIISLRLDGMTLEATAQATGITRERVRQIQKRWLSPKLKVEEMRYLYFWEKYPALESSDVQYVLNLPDRTTRYLEMIEDISMPDEREPSMRAEVLRRIALESELDADARQRAQVRAEEIDGDFIVNGKKVRKNRPALLRYIVEKYAQERTRCVDLKARYEELLEKLGLADDDSFRVDLRYFDHLASADYTLWNRRKSLRYYDIPSHDYSALLEALQLERLQDVEYSALKFFRDLPDVMRDYDIHDEYELHNLLRKIWQRDDRNAGLDEHHQVTFAKMPTIRIGKPNRYDQIYQFILEHEPVKKADFISLYAKEYGVKIQMFQGNAPLQDFDQYCYGGEYRIHWKSLPAEILADMKTRLTEDFYTKKEIIEIYLEVAWDGKPWDINAYMLHQLGFESHGNYVVRETYDSAADLFTHVLTSADIVDLRDKHYYRNYSPFRAAVEKLAANCRVLEVEPDIFYSGKELAKRGITAEGVRAFCQNVRAFVPEDALFTVYSLRRHGFTLPWVDAGLSDFFYNSVLSTAKDDFASLVCGGGELFYNGTLGKPLSVSDLFAHVADKAQEALSIQELQTLIQLQFGLQAKPDKIKEFVNENLQYKEKILF